MAISGSPADISKSSFLDQARFSGLRPLAQLFSQEGLKKLGESVITFLKPRLSFNPDTLLNRTLNSLHDACARVGLAKPRQPVPDVMYARNFEVVGQDKCFSDVTGYLQPKGIKDFTELSRLVMIAGINSNGTGAPQRMESKAYVQAVKEKKQAYKEMIDAVKLNKGSEFSKELEAKKEVYDKACAKVEQAKPTRYTNEVMPGVQLFCGAVTDGPARALFDKLPPNLKEALQENGSIVDKNTGLVASVVYDTSDAENAKLRVVFGGTGSGAETSGSGITKEHLANDVSTVGLVTSHVPPSYLQARELVGVLKGVVENAMNPKVGLEVSGFSMGGGLASYAGIYNQVKTLSHCGTALSPACQRSLGPEKIRTSVEKNLIFNTSVNKDAVTDCTHLNKFALGWEKVSGLQVARHVGPFLQVSREGMGEHEQSKWGFGAHCKSFELFSDMNEHLLWREEQIKADLDRVRT
jgi:hypothetical protein